MEEAGVAGGGAIFTHTWKEDVFAVQSAVLLSLAPRILVLATKGGVISLAGQKGKLRCREFQHLLTQQ